jgi:hypothetical protein
MKNFIKPDLSIVISFLVLGTVLFFTKWWWIAECCDSIYYQGLPFPVYYWGGFVGDPKTFVPISFLIDVVIWYFIAVVIVSGIKRLRRK